jgi:hypothetical protein
MSKQHSKLPIPRIRVPFASGRGYDSSASHGRPPPFLLSSRRGTPGRRHPTARPPGLAIGLVSSSSGSSGPAEAPQLLLTVLLERVRFGPGPNRHDPCGRGSGVGRGDDRSFGPTPGQRPPGGHGQSHAHRTGATSSSSAPEWIGRGRRTHAIDLARRHSSRNPGWLGRRAGCAHDGSGSAGGVAALAAPEPVARASDGWRASPCTGRPPAPPHGP